MILRVYDTDKENPVCAVVESVDYDYQAEEYLLEVAEDIRSRVPGSWAIRAELHDDKGLRAVWERPDGDTRPFELVRAVSEFGTR